MNWWQLIEKMEISIGLYLAIPHIIRCSQSRVDSIKLADILREWIPTINGVLGEIKI